MSSGTISGFSGTGVFLSSGNFYMTGGTIKENKSTLNHPGVWVESGCHFDMVGGTIENNEAQRGAGVSVHQGLFTMTYPAEIKNNKAQYSGGGVEIYSGTFTMNSGTISGNIAGEGGGGVEVDSGDGDGVFNMTGGIISGNTNTNTVLYGGGGVYVYHGVFSMSGGTISGNKSDLGAGVCVNGGSGPMYGKFVMSGYSAVITGNRSYTDGLSDAAGVYIKIRDGTPYNQFVKSGGTITGGDTDQIFAVLAKSGITVIRKRTATVGAGTFPDGSLNVDTATNWDL
jgi:hypothetical protein